MKEVQDVRVVDRIVVFGGQATCATLLLSRSVHPKLVPHPSWHANITMTFDRYSHWILSMGRHGAAKTYSLGSA
jgi:hypothetical protein